MNQTFNKPFAAISEARLWAEILTELLSRPISTDDLFQNSDSSQIEKIGLKI